MSPNRPHRGLPRYAQHPEYPTRRHRSRVKPYKTGYPTRAGRGSRANAVLHRAEPQKRSSGGEVVYRAVEEMKRKSGRVAEGRKTGRRRFEDARRKSNEPRLGHSRPLGVRGGGTSRLPQKIFCPTIQDPARHLGICFCGDIKHTPDLRRACARNSPGLSPAIVGTRWWPRKRQVLPHLFQIASRRYPR